MTFTTRALSSVMVGQIAALVLSGCSPSVLPPPLQPTLSTVPPLSTVPQSVVAAAVSVTKATLAPDKVAYVFAIRLSESGGVPATIPAANVQFDNGFGGYCEYGAAQLGQNRLAANGTLEMDSLTCGYSGSAAFNAQVQVIFTDDNRHDRTVSLLLNSL